ncbi:MAG: response regulator [Clostridia bacterium]|nr:response regulator [Clostridia bacterium]
MHFNVLIALSDSREVQLTAERLEAYGCTIAGRTDNGKQIIELVHKLHPNVVIMEPIMPAMNCDEIAAILEDVVAYPLVKIVFSSFRSNELAGRFYSSGGDAFLLAPIDIHTTIRRMEDYMTVRMRQSNQGEVTARVRNLARQALVQLNTPMNLNGFYYLMDAISLSVQEPELLKNIITQLYPRIARLHQQSITNIERCMRTAVEQTFEQGDIKILYPLFSSTIRPKTGKPTNGSFISVLTHRVMDQLY